MRSGRDQTDAVTNYLQEESAQHHVIDPPFSGRRAHLSSFGVIPKPLYQVNRTNLGPFFSLRSHCQRRYRSTSLFVAVLTGQRCGDANLSVGARNTTGKGEHPERYRLIHIHTDNYHLLGMRWRESASLDAALQFRLRSVPKIFSTVADVLLWVMFRRGVSSAIHVHCLDNFLFCGAAGSGKCAQNLASALTTCRELGVPVAEHKRQGSSTVLTVLGIEIDTVHMQLRLLSE